MRLEVGSTNSNSRVVANYFVGWIRHVGGIAKVVYVLITEQNGLKIAGIQPFFRRDCNDSQSSCKSFMYGKSSSKQRFEAWWGQRRRNCTEWWINQFKYLRDFGLYCDGYVVHVECLKFCSTHFETSFKELLLNGIYIALDLQQTPVLPPEDPTLCTSSHP